MKSSIHNMTQRVLLSAVLLFSVASVHAECNFQSIAYGQTVSGSLSVTDCTDDVSGTIFYADYYQFTGAVGDRIYIQQSSSSIDPWLMLILPSGDYLTDNNGGGGSSARIPATSNYYTLVESGTYLLEASSNDANSTGSYTLILAKEASQNSAQTDSNFSDSWWNANESGWGITITDHDSNAFLQWYTYDQTGHNQKYVISGGTFSSDRCQFSGTIQHVTGPSWTLNTFDPNLVTRRTAGTGSIDFCPAGLATGTIVFNYTADGVTASKQLTRLSFGNDVPRWGCTANTGAPDFTDLWWNSSESGWGVSFTQHGSTAFFRAFVYDTDGRPLLFIVPSASASSDGKTFAGSVTLTTGPWFGNNPFDPAQVERTTAGTATMTFSDGNNGVLSYTVNGVTKTKAVTRLTFGGASPEDCGVAASYGDLSGNATDQERFIAARGYPHLFALSFVTDTVSGGEVVPLSPPRRIETWVYNDANMTTSLFDNGFFISQETLGAHTSIKSTNLKPENFTLGMTEAQVISVAGQPTCVDTAQIGGMSFRFLRYASTADSPVAAIGLVNGALVSVSAGFLFGDQAEPGADLCSTAQ